MKNIIIGIAGQLNSGKDTVASMINYIHQQGVTKASYRDWQMSQSYYDTNFKHKIIHFADPLKDCLSIIYNIPREYFDDRIKKDEEYYLLNERVFINKESFKDKYHEITIEDLKEHSLNELLYDTINNIGIKIRTLMQYYGTEICRNHLDQQIWIKSVMGKAANIADRYGLCIIPDVRFNNEADSIMNCSLYGGVIKINRDNCVQTNHSSEIMDIPYDIELDNNGTKMQLFYKTIEVYKKLIK